jgi:hypothetical protein
MNSALQVRSRGYATMLPTRDHAVIKRGMRNSEFVTCMRDASGPFLRDDILLTIRVISTSAETWNDICSRSCCMVLICWKTNCGSKTGAAGGRNPERRKRLQARFRGETFDLVLQFVVFNSILHAATQRLIARDKRDDSHSKAGGTSSGTIFS